MLCFADIVPRVLFDGRVKRRTGIAARDIMLYLITPSMDIMTPTFLYRNTSEQ